MKITLVVTTMSGVRAEVEGMTPDARFWVEKEFTLLLGEPVTVEVLEEVGK